MHYENEEEMSKAELEREQDEKGNYEAQLEAEENARQAAEEGEWMAQMKHDEEIRGFPLKVIIMAIIEKEERGQLSPQTIRDLKILLSDIELVKDI